jgi:hypothetical protein
MILSLLGGMVAAGFENFWLCSVLYAFPAGWGVGTAIGELIGY